MTSFAKQSKKPGYFGTPMMHQEVQRAYENSLQASKSLTAMPEYKKHQLAKKQAMVERLSKNGITPKDLENEYQKGYDNARQDLTSFCFQFFYCAAAIASHNLYGFGESRIERLLSEMQRIMEEEISREDIRERCRRETGVDVIESGYDKPMIDIKPFQKTKYDRFTDKSLTSDPWRQTPVKEGVYIKEVELTPLNAWPLPEPYRPIMLDPAIQRHRRFIMVFLGWRSKGHARWKMLERAERLCKKKKKRSEVW